MTTYEVIDAFADAIIPLLLLTTLGLVLYSLLKKQFAVSCVIFFELVAVLGIVYSLRYIDIQLNIWLSFGGDYSTHTAVCVALLSVLYHAVGYLKTLLVVLVGYAALMLYQEYHSLLDVVTTVVALAPFLVGVRLASRGIFNAGSTSVLL